MDWTSKRIGVDSKRADRHVGQIHRCALHLNEVRWLTSFAITEHA